MITYFAPKKMIDYLIRTIFTTCLDSLTTALRNTINEQTTNIDYLFLLLLLLISIMDSLYKEARKINSLK